MTALQDWLSISPMNPHAVKALFLDLLRVGADRPQRSHGPKIMQPGLERC
ncbi:hypothetical protein [Arthrobacter sp. SLBN-53]|nr:hypothetical protein [Arthrobacter sp. SLBN-53]TQK31905.1 hypothetical protein FBY28_4950 [Arthrobacter sp. SLBN-53]